LTAAYAAHVSAHARQDGYSLTAVTDEMEAIGAIPFAAAAAADAATAFATAGRADSARFAATRSRELHERCDGGPLPVVSGLDPGEITLTARERQLVELAGRGRTNVQIAEQLVLSVRTVESHLYRAMHKLGVSDRRML
jgi:DNA-binding NarL/FixJ family response regulator